MSVASSTAAPSGGRLTLWPLRIAYLVYAAGAIMAAISANLPATAIAFARDNGLPGSKILWVLLALGAIVALPIYGISFLLKLLSKPRYHAFERELMRLMQAREEGDELLSLFSKQRFLLLVGERYLLFDKLGLIHSHLQNHSAAADAYRDALDEAPRKKQVEIAIKLADSLRHAGRLQEAERFYREVHAVTQKHVESNQALARLVLQRDGEVKEAVALLKEAIEATQDGEPMALTLRSELALLQLQQGEIKAAELLVDEAKAIANALDIDPEHDPLLEETMAALARAKGK